ncbi:hypothetical protein COE15_19220 [Bacillus cereus]|nr:hypothetical protein CN288_06520 [Bacillus sp. AFS023182]PGX96520.1 hypothetical protein COE15_19220 [Bacillus cereus]
MTTKKGEGYTNKGAVKLQVTLCRVNYLNNQLFWFGSNPESQKYHICKNSILSFYIANVILSCSKSISNVQYNFIFRNLVEIIEEEGR